VNEMSPHRGIGNMRMLRLRWSEDASCASSLLVRTGVAGAAGDL
jgi:hypothetical protein